MKKVALLCGIAGGALVGWNLRPRAPPFERHLHAQQVDTHTDVVLPQQCIRNRDPREVAAVERSLRHVRRMMLEQSIPGAVLAVSKDGKLVCSVGLGYSDVENGVLCSPQTVMRIASISKAMSAIALMQLWEKGKVDLDAPIQKYVPYFPEKEFAGKPVTITTRQLLTHTSGIRHYDKDPAAAKGAGRGEFQQAEYYIKDHYDSVKDSVQIFAKDNLVFEPGQTFHYTTHAWALVSAVIESVTGKTYLDYMKDNIFQPLGMTSTGPEVHPTLLYGRSRYYWRDDKGTLLNTAYVDNSYKWAGGGFVSTAEDLVKLGNAALACLQLGRGVGGDGLGTAADRPQPLLLRPNTVAAMWTLAVSMGREDLPSCQYGLGWFVVPHQEGTLCGRDTPFSAGHGGAAIGATSALVVLPSSLSGGVTDADGGHGGVQPPQGVVVAVIFNLQGVKQVYKLGLKIAEEFNY